MTTLDQIKTETIYYQTDHSSIIKLLTMPGQHLAVWADMFGIYMPRKGTLYHPALT